MAHVIQFGSFYVYKVKNSGHEPTYSIIIWNLRKVLALGLRSSMVIEITIVPTLSGLWEAVRI